jgi:CheY-like chemotaxis protein
VKVLDILIVACTAYYDEKDKGNAFVVGMKDFISKPIQIIELERLFEKWILQPKLNY